MKGAIMARFQVELTEQEQSMFDFIKRRAYDVNDAGYIYVYDALDSLIMEFGDANICFQVIGELSRKGWIDIVDDRFGVSFWLMD